MVDHIERRAGSEQSLDFAIRFANLQNSNVVIRVTNDVCLEVDLPEINCNLTIEGNGYGISGRGSCRIFEIAGGNVTINNMILTRGKAKHGGAIRNFGTLRLKNCTLMSNSADWNGGAIRNRGELSVINSRFDQNSSGPGGGAIHNKARAKLVDCTFSKNSAEMGGGAVANYEGILSVSNSTFIGNNGGWHGGAIYNMGKLCMSNTTFTRNSALLGGGGLYALGGQATLKHLTLLENSALEGGGIRVVDAAHINLFNSIVAFSKGGDCVGDLCQNLGNLIEDGSCNPILRGDPMLLPLTGSPPVHPLHASSPAINAAHPDYCLPTDQHGKQRPQGHSCDIGAFEFIGDRTPEQLLKMWRDIRSD